ncbi:MAG: hypothetical protein ING59_00915 [Burkholderiales bacterium]|jgi:hypothetical protein|nr:hypothetical protein [Burkholderiales bacterium]
MVGRQIANLLAVAVDRERLDDATLRIGHRLQQIALRANQALDGGARLLGVEYGLRGWFVDSPQYIELLTKCLPLDFER